MSTGERPPVWRRLSVLGYGLLAYLAFQVSTLYYVGFLANVGPVSGIDEGPAVPLAEAVVVNVGVIALFGLQHSGMARSRFKDRVSAAIPEPIQRSTYVLAASVLLLAIAWVWRPIPTVVWDVGGPLAWVLWGVFGLGLVVVVVSSFQIDHYELFGLRQVYAYYRGRGPEPVPFQTPGFYRYVRHPLMTGLLMWFWATPHMTVGHLLLAAGFTAYIVVGVRLEERILLDAYGERYREYRRQVPMFVPRPWRSFEPGRGSREETAD